MRRKKPVLDIEDQHCQRPWTDYKAQQVLQQQHHTEAENRAARHACGRLIEGDYLSWEELLGKR